MQHRSNVIRGSLEEFAVAVTEQYLKPTLELIGADILGTAVAPTAASLGLPAGIVLIRAALG